MSRILLTLIFVFQSISCEKQSEKNAFPNVIFRENKSLISSVIYFDKLSIALPKGLTKIEKSDFNKLEKQFENLDKPYFNVDVLSIYSNGNGFMFMISKLTHEEIIYDVVNNKVGPDLIEVYGQDNFNKFEFSINNNPVLQFVGQGEKLVNYKLFVNVLNNQCFQIDYFIPINNYIKLTEAMEASISTINIRSKENKDEK